MRGLVCLLAESSRQKGSSFHFFPHFSLLNLVLDQTQVNSDLTCFFPPCWSGLIGQKRDETSAEREAQVECLPLNQYILHTNEN